MRVTMGVKRIPRICEKMGTDVKVRTSEVKDLFLFKIIKDVFSMIKNNHKTSVEIMDR